MLSPSFVREYRGRSEYPSFAAPDFKGAHAIKDAFEKKVAFTGVTVHFVDAKMDHGPVILQEKIAIKKRESLACLERGYIIWNQALSAGD
jgi:folate-dependent phosphoribosylglycinamide formyltransferase PurN